MFSKTVEKSARNRQQAVTQSNGKPKEGELLRA